MIENQLFVRHLQLDLSIVNSVQGIPMSCKFYNQKQSCMRALLLLIGGLFLISATNPPSEGIEFFQGSFSSAKIKASEEGRLFFLDFTASWCTPCRWMEETTFTDPTLAAYVKENYVALQVDIDDFDGFELKQEYNIRILPSLLIFNSKGELLGQYEESLSPSRMLEILKQYDNPNNRVSSNPMKATYSNTTNTSTTSNHNETTPSYSNNTIANEQTHVSQTEELEMPATFTFTRPSAETNVEMPTVDYTSNRPAAVEQRVDQKVEATPTNTVAEVEPKIIRKPLVKKERTLVSIQDTERELQPNLPTTPSTNNNIVTSTTYNETNEKPLSHLTSLDPYTENGEGLYRYQVNRQPTVGYSVQVGAYYEYSNFLQQVSIMQEHFNMPVIVHVSKKRNRSLYKLMLGEFRTRTEAIDFMRTVQAKGLDCMIKNLSNH